MSIKVTCLQCGVTNSVNDRLAGKRVRCPECDTAVHVPEADGVPEADVIRDKGIRDNGGDTGEETPAEVEVVEAEPVAAEPVTAEPVTAEPVVAQPLAAVAVAPQVVPAQPVNLFDDDDDDDDGEGLGPRKKLEDDELDMTSMVDVTFLLLIFFVVTASFQLQKSIMMPRQQTDAPSTSAVEEDPEELDQVELQIDERGAFLVLAADWEAETPGKQNLITKLKEALGDNETKLVIKVQEQAKLQSLVDGMDAGSIAGYSEIIVTQVEDFD